MYTTLSCCIRKNSLNSYYHGTGHLADLCKLEIPLRKMEDFADQGSKQPPDDVVKIVSDPFFFRRVSDIQTT